MKKASLNFRSLLLPVGGSIAFLILMALLFWARSTEAEAHTPRCAPEEPGYVAEYGYV